METRYFNTLQAVLESGSFSRAASDLNITQSAVSQRIRFMEEQYGMPLVERSGSVIAATTAGGVVLKKARQILALENDLQNELRSLVIKAHITLCCTPTFGIVYLPLVLHRFFLANCDVNIKSALKTPEEALKGILANEFAVAVIEHSGKLETLDAVAFSLPPDELTFVSSPSLGLSSGTLPLSALLEQRLIARRDGCSSRCLLQDNLSKSDNDLEDFRGLDVHNELHLTIQSALAGHGVAFVSKSLVQKLIEKGELRAHHVEGFQYFRSRTIIINRRNCEDGLIKEFIESVNEVFDTGS